MTIPVLDLDLTLPLAGFTLRVKTELSEGVTAVMGPSGAGKTSLLEAIAGLRPRARGRIAMGGDVFLDSRTRWPPERRRVGYVPQDAGLFPHLTVFENVRFGARADTEAVAAAIDTLEIRPLLDRRTGGLSGGEQQRVALARALAIRPRLLLLDEPLAGLDPGLRERILPWLLKVRDEWALPCLYVTHNVGEALAAASYLLVLRRGRVEAEGEPQTVLSTPAVVDEAAAGLENLLPGHVLTHDADGGITRVRTRAGFDVSITLAADHAVGAAVTLTVRSEDILVCRSPVEGLSARNVYPARIVALERTGPDIVVRGGLENGGGELMARVTPAAVAALGLAVGRQVWLAMKSHSIRIV